MVAINTFFFPDQGFYIRMGGLGCRYRRSAQRCYRRGDATEAKTSLGCSLQGAQLGFGLLPLGVHGFGPGEQQMRCGGELALLTSRRLRDAGFAAVAGAGLWLFYRPAEAEYALPGLILALCCVGAASAGTVAFRKSSRS